MQLAQEKQVEFNVSQLTGRKRSENTMGVDTFEMDPESGVIKACPAGHSPVVSTFNEKQNVYTAKFLKTDCQSCPLLDQCPIQQQKKFNTALKYKYFQEPYAHISTCLLCWHLINNFFSFSSYVLTYM